MVLLWFSAFGEMWTVPASRGIGQKLGDTLSSASADGERRRVSTVPGHPEPLGKLAQPPSSAALGPQEEAQRPRPGPPAPGPGGTCKRRHPFCSTSWQLLPATPNFFWLCRARSLNVLGFRDTADILRAFGASGRTYLAGRSGASSPRLQ